MGNIMNKVTSPIQAIRGRKRKRSDVDSDASDENSDLLDKSLATPKRKKLISTAKYIYQALFKEERNSDITVHALGKLWRLHKVYLSQSPYFASMFNGSWREADEDYVHIEIIDPKITIESLYSVFGSLYMDEVVLEPREIVSTLATATLFQLDSLIDRCAEVMIETTNAETAVKYYEAACEYGVKSVKHSTFRWLLVNLLTLYYKTDKWLRLISIELMELLVASPDLYVIQTEVSLYTMLRSWVYLKLNPAGEEGCEKLASSDEQMQYFAHMDETLPFLKTENGKPFEACFRSLRLHNLINHHVDIGILVRDNIMPLEWLNEPVFQQWNSMLLIDQSLDKGPKDINEKVFLDSCIRCGITLAASCNRRWRWTGFNFGLDLIMISDTKTLRVKRHHRTENERLLSLQVKRQFLIRVSLASLNDLRQIKHQQTTPIQSISLDKNEEAMLIMLDKELTYPLHVSINMLVVSPSRTNMNTSGVGPLTGGPSSPSRQQRDAAFDEEPLEVSGSNTAVYS
ncbi:protein germ cell-less [Toxorhynchites rutilus septentrionalis]|uniref:protein germ cell-less n=1 Tax=Toxorhynchites rutilus septentrionalis TaxID=329112 RepID=UPI00247970E4|nr:protein germ cell-less [Toxorhynchites rutilus septentrionalis]XP_055624565.1 protein germ cell-less [Toxorhynchites rutilus septentrionalis]XP_055624567.1 protein germ cell-less [Toxorhynchites rutilus septentrionalis]XP_055624568.1 protein germ cell-less [Toxorhynchites rutilus septentrionalis]XP_055624569.1 protein germ cell-less [Toxorhynchites rutilus septentrionalis]